MKKRFLSLIFLISIVTSFSFADSFTDAIQDLAVVAACKGTYNLSEAYGNTNEESDDYYRPQMLQNRFAQESGNMTRTLTFFGVCFDYAQFAWQDITEFKSWYNQQGMYEGQFWLAGTHNTSSPIELMGIGTKTDYTRLQNGVPIKTYSSSTRNVKAHGKATKHAWLWIERADGVWFWIDPTWTDIGGYVVYGYVNKNGEEIQCRPDKNIVSCGLIL
ncbi:MAG: hypothetical protein ACTTIT_05560 [Treponema sp.]